MVPYSYSSNSELQWSGLSTTCEHLRIARLSESLPKNISNNNLTHPPQFSSIYVYMSFSSVSNLFGHGTYGFLERKMSEEGLCRRTSCCGHFSAGWALSEFETIFLQQKAWHIMFFAAQSTLLGNHTPPQRRPFVWSRPFSLWGHRQFSFVFCLNKKTAH